ncbi:MAG: hypothetical protein P8188_05650 [Gemmatimonadota bacterium]|jgi:hypothetical protein
MPSDDAPPRHKPTPVRQALPGDDPTDEKARFDVRSFEVASGETWHVEELGWTRSGRRQDAGAILLLLGFRQDLQGDFEREVMVAARRLEELSLEELTRLLDEARPYQAVPRDRPFFQGTRRRTGDARGRGRRGRSRE